MARKRTHTRRQARSNPQGRIEMRRGGFGFVQTAEGKFYVSRKASHGAFPGDLVELVPMKQKHRTRSGGSGNSGESTREARVVRVIERANDEILGYYHVAEPFGVVVPVDPCITHDIFTKLADAPDVPDGSVVRVAITAFPSRNSAATGQVIEVIGDEDDERLPVDLIVAANKLETKFSARALEQANVAEVDVQGALAAGYVDLRERFIFTIDPEDARDFDDAVSLEPAELPNGKAGWRLGVHIADVSSYVSWDSSVDLDARRRATSVYLVDRVIPMLPEALSNDICSLKPGEDRRTMTVDLLLDDAGEVVAAKPFTALIRSHARLSYEQAQEFLDRADGDAGVYACAYAGAALDGNADAQQLNQELMKRIVQLSALAKKRAARRIAQGGLEFDTTEAKVRLDAEGYPIGVDLRKKTDATQLIEEAMIMTNEAVARFLRDAKFPCIYRVHEQPAPDSLASLVSALSEFPWFAKVNERAFLAGNPHALQDALVRAEGRPESTLVATLVLRAMQRAVYSPILAGHYGLASEAYAHFTSPIRRYPDLVVHRMLKAKLNGRPEKFDQEVSNLAWIAEHSSEMERIAERAARDSQEAKMCELMEAHVGEKFSALVTGVGNVGLFVQLDNMAEGLVRISDLGQEYFVYDSVRHALTGSDTGKEFRLGRRIAVRLVEADRHSRQLRFVPL